jgi:hypothetical protein
MHTPTKGLNYMTRALHDTILELNHAIRRPIYMTGPLHDTTIELNHPIRRLIHITRTLHDTTPELNHPTRRSIYMTGPLHDTIVELIRAIIRLHTSAPDLSGSPCNSHTLLLKERGTMRKNVIVHRFLIYQTKHTDKLFKFEPY